MFIYRTVSKQSLIALIGSASALVLAIACQPEPAPLECPPPPPQKQMEITPLKIPHGPDEDFCNACVRSQAGFVSCQREYELKKGEPRESLKKRSIEKACKDAGFPVGQCPEPALVGVQCRNDQPNPGGMTAGQALQFISGRKQNPSETAPAKDGTPAGNPPAEDKKATPEKGATATPPISID